jgi:hypothetical protein
MRTSAPLRDVITIPGCCVMCDSPFRFFVPGMGAATAGWAVPETKKSAPLDMSVGYAVQNYRLSHEHN